MNLKDYIRCRFGGNMSEFARSINKHRQQVDKWLRAKCIVINGQVYRPVTELKKGNENE